MAGRVNLNVPPRLIESARAAQYANREVQSAAEQARRLRGKVQQRQEAARRAQPQAQAADRRGGVFDAPAINRAPRIWRRRRALTGYKYGAAYLTIGNLESESVYRISSPNGKSYLLFSPPSTTSPIAQSAGHLSVRPSAFDVDLSALPESGYGGNGSRLVIYHSPVSRPAPGSGFPYQPLYVNSTSATTTATNWAILPAGESGVVIVYSHYFGWLDYYFDGVGDAPNYQVVGPEYPFERLALGSGGSGFALTQRAFYVSESTAKEIAVGSGFRAFTESAIGLGSFEVEVWNYPYFLGPDSRQYLGKLRLPQLPAPPGPLPGSKPTGYQNGYTGGEAFASYSRSVDYYSMVRFGDLNSGGVAPLYGFGPGIYSYLANPSAANAAVDAAGTGPWAKQAAAEQFIGSSLLPDGSLSDSSIDLKRALLYQGQFPPPGRSISAVGGLQRYALLPVNGKDDSLWELQDDETGDSVVSASSTAPRTPLLQTPPAFAVGSGSSNTYPILFWDWGNPDYCRRQLVSLGFNASELAP
jgi:hypothetical protein